MVYGISNNIKRIGEKCGRDNLKTLSCLALTPLHINNSGDLENILGQIVDGKPQSLGLQIIQTTMYATSYEFQQAILQTLQGHLSSPDKKYGYVEGQKGTVAMNGEASNICYVPIQIYIL